MLACHACLRIASMHLQPPAPSCMQDLKEIKEGRHRFPGRGRRTGGAFAAWLPCALSWAALLGHTALRHGIVDIYNSFWPKALP